MKSLVLAEKPSAAKEFASVLGCKKKGNGYYEGTDYIVTWALGHLVTLKQPEDYGDKFKTWNVNTLPMIPEKLETKIIPGGGKKQFYTIKDLAGRNDINELIIATDAGREGELVARLIMKHINWKKPFKRLWISSLTANAIKEGFRKLKPGRDYDNLFRAAKCRSEADWLIGLNVSRSLAIKYNDQLSAGRVQTPTLAMMVKREREIKNFKPLPFWTIEANLPGFTAKYTDKNNNTRIFDEEEAERLKKELSGKPALVKKIVKKEKKELPPLLYDLTELQRAANNIYGFTATKTLKTLQNLYEYHKAVTYPRTDSRYITDDIVPTLNGLLQNLPSEFKDFTGKIKKNNFKINKRCVNNARVSDHHALLPTEERVSMTVLTSDEVRLYNLIVKRFLENFYPDFIYEEKKVFIEISGHTFTAQGTGVLNMGWKEVEGRRESEKSLPDLKEGDKISQVTLDLKKGYTEPPPRHTEASLLEQMEKNNLGTPATRAQIIEKLININYVERKERILVPMPKGEQIIGIVEPELQSPELTARWEKELGDIEKGRKKSEDFMTDIIENTKKLVKKTLTAEKDYKHDGLINMPCPDCGKDLLQVKKKNRLMQVCSSRTCRYNRVITEYTERRCSTCKKKMERKETKGGMMYVCRNCNIHTKISDVKEGGGKATARDLARINKESDTEFKKAGNPFASLKDLF